MGMIIYSGRAKIKKARSKIERALVARGGPEPPTSGL
jgi:hypothetical protein